MINAQGRGVVQKLKLINLRRESKCFITLCPLQRKPFIKDLSVGKNQTNFTRSTTERQKTEKHVYAYKYGTVVARDIAGIRMECTFNTSLLRRVMNPYRK